MRGPGQRRPHRLTALRNPALARILRLRRQIPARPGQDRAARADLAAKKGRAAPSGRRVLPRRGVQRHGPRRFPPRVCNQPALHQRDQYHPRLHLDQHVSQDVGAQRPADAQADRSPHRAGPGTPRGEKGHALHAIIKMCRFSVALLLLCLTAARADDLETQIRRFVEAYATVEREAADPVEPAKAFYEGAIPGLLRRLDPHSVFFDPGQFDQLKKLETSTQKGFGSVVSILPGRIIVLQTLPGTPSAKSGIAPGDEILAINGYAIDRLDMDQMIQLLTQSRQQPARLAVRRPGNARVLDFVLTPEEMQAPSVERAFLLKPSVGYLRVASFDEKTGEQIKAAIEKLGGTNLKGLVLDLRNNPGGLLPAALYTSALFLEPGLKILSVRGRKVEEQEQTVPPGSMP